MPEPTTTQTETPATPNIPAKFIKDGKPDYVAFANSYSELEKRLGTPTPATPSTPPLPNPDPAAVQPQTPPPASIAKFEEEFVKNAGKLSDESYKELETKFNLTKDTVNDFITFRQTRATEYAQKVVDAVGGQAAYAQLTQWAGKNLTPQEAEAFDTAIKTMDLNTATIALGQLKTRYETANGRDPSLLGGSVSAKGLRPFATMKEAVMFRSKPGYATDPDIQHEYNERLKISNIL